MRRHLTRHDRRHVIAAEARLLLRPQEAHGSGNLGAVEAEDLAATRRLRGASLAEARLDPLAVVALIGDSGGTIYLTAPVRLVECDQAPLETLLSDLDAVRWTCGEVASVTFEHHPIGGLVPGGDGGGPVVDGVWVHPKYFDEQVRRCAIRSRARHAITPAWRHVARPPCRRGSSGRRTVEDETGGTCPHGRNIEIPWDFDIFPPLIPFPDSDE